MGAIEEPNPLDDFEISEYFLAVQWKDTRA
jgi:hypothetical protein